MTPICEPRQGQDARCRGDHTLRRGAVAARPVRGAGCDVTIAEPRDVTRCGDVTMSIVLSEAKTGSNQGAPLASAAQGERLIPRTNRQSLEFRVHLQPGTARRERHGLVVGGR
jgi:hypothetical protein